MEKNRKIRRKWKMVVAIVFVLAVMIGIGLEGEERSVEGEPDVISSMIVNNEQYLTVVANRNEIEKEKEFKKLLILLDGMTLQDVGKQYNVSRERIRQIKKRYISKAPKLQEDKYAYIFQKYNLLREDFLLGFDNNVATYNYLSMAYKRGNENVEQMLEDPELSEHEKVCVEKIIYKNYVTLNGERVLKTRSGLSEYLLRTIGKKGITFDEFKELYQMLLEDLGLENNSKFTLMDRGYENKMAASNHVLWKHHKKMRYYNIDSYEYDDLFKTLNLNQYNNIEISALKLFRENPEVMREYDIQDEYELHNLLKKICPKDMDISFKRMPNIEFGKADRDKQVMDLLLEMAPVTNRRFTCLRNIQEETGNTQYMNMVSLFGLWDYGKVVPYLLIAVYRKDVEKCIQLIKEVLMESQKPWKMVESPLYYRYVDTVQGKSFSGVGNNFVRALATEIENKEEYEFLKGNKELEAIFSQYLK